MDMRKYATGYIKPDDVRDGPRQERIVKVFESEKYGRPVLDLESGDQFILNEKNTRILNKAFGYESDRWPGLVIEFVLDHYKDRKSEEEKETVTVRPISVRQPSDNGGTKAIQPRPRTSLDADIPF
jgi:hypothetical protein